MQLVTPPVSLAVTRWLTEASIPFGRLIEFGPAEFEAAARVRFIPDPSETGQAEADVDLPADHPSDLAQAQRALHRLAAFTATADECYFCVWEGYSNVALPKVTDAELVVVPHRRYALFRGPLVEIDTFADEFGDGHPVAPPAFVWPADHRWCFASDVDPHWAGIGAEQTAVDALLDDPLLDVVQADPEQPQPTYF